MTPEEDRKPKKDWRIVPFFKDITHEARDFLEGVCNIRYFEFEQTLRDGVPGSKTYGQVIDRWTSVESVRVKPLAREFGQSGVAEYVIAPGYTERDLEWLQGTRDEAERRAAAAPFGRLARR
jgi:hypothetical protein